MDDGYPRIAQWRERRGLTQAELAGQIGINRVSLARIESGRTDPQASTLRRLALMLTVSVEDLYRPPTGGTEDLAGAREELLVARWYLRAGLRALDGKTLTPRERQRLAEIAEEIRADVERVRERVDHAST